MSGNSLDSMNILTERLRIQAAQAAQKKATAPAPESEKSFEQVLSEQLARTNGEKPAAMTAAQLRLQQAAQASARSGEINFSKHAMERIGERGIEISAEMMAKLKEAIGKAAQKGIRNTLVLSEELALIVNTGSGTVVTAMKGDDMRENVITNIDGTVIL